MNTSVGRVVHPNEPAAIAVVLAAACSASTTLSASLVSEDAALLVGGSTCQPSKACYRTAQVAPVM